MTASSLSENGCANSDDSIDNGNIATLTIEMNGNRDVVVNMTSGITLLDSIKIIEGLNKAIDMVENFKRK